MLFDTHAHYDDRRFDEDRFELLCSMPENNVGLIMNACAEMKDIGTILEMCKQFPYVYGAVGVHPSGCGEMTEDDIETLRGNTSNPKIKAIGEIGLDYYYDNVPKEVQKKWFSRQLELAKEVNLPVIIHDREAHRDTMDILKGLNADRVGGVIHCFSGSREMAREVMDLGFYIAFGGVLTFKNARKVVEVAEYVPLDRLLLETDSPYLAPVPVRSKRNNSILMKYAAEKLAEIKGISVEEVEKITFENGKKCFKIGE